jgi:hypothetical protein
VTGPEIPRQPSGVCEVADPATPGGAITALDIDRVASLPPYATAVMDLPGGDERFGNVTLAVDVAGDAVVHLSATQDLTRTIFVELDLSEDITAQDGYLAAHLPAGNGTVGSITINGEDGFFFQGSLEQADFESQPSGVFALTFRLGLLGVWPPDHVPGDAEKAIIAELDGEEVRVVGRLLGICMTTLQNGIPARVMDISAHAPCEELLAGL